MRPDRTSRLFVAVLAVALAANLDLYGGGKPPVPPGARVVLELDKTEFFLGENVLVHYRLENLGKAPFQVEYGGDYRFASRHLRFQVTATGPDGKAVDDPDPSGFYMGGLGGTFEVKPGESYVQSLPLTRYCRFEAPGTYTLRVKHDLGWKEEGGARKVPVGETKLTLVMPTPDQARDVVVAMDRLPKDTGGMAGKKSDPYPDFTALGYAVYLPLLVDRAEAKSADALAGLGTIAEPEATRALIRLTGHRDAKFALDAARTLNDRLPDPELEGKLGPRNVFDNARKAARLRLSGRSWRAGFAPEVRARARTLLAARGVDEVGCGAFMIECVGTPDDLPDLIAALDRAVTQTAEKAREQGIYPVPRGDCQELLRAARMLVLRGVTVPDSPKSPGEAALWLTALKERPAFRPVGWEGVFLDLLAHKIHYLRSLALVSLAEPVPPSVAGPLADRLPGLVADPDVDVQIAACTLAGKMKAVGAKGSVLKVLTTVGPDDWLATTATDAAGELGALPEALEIWADRLGEPGMAVPAITALIRVARYTGGYGFDGAVADDEALALRPRWRAFLREHREAIATGRRFPAGGPELTPGLFPKVFHFYGEGKPGP